MRYLSNMVYSLITFDERLKMVHTGFRIEKDILRQARKKAGLIGLSHYLRTLLKMWLAGKIEISEEEIVQYGKTL